MMIHMLEEVDGLISDKVTREVLCQVYKAHNESAVVVNAFG